MLLEWVDGESFAARPRAATAFQSCGDLLGRLHTFPAVGVAGGLGQVSSPLPQSKTPTEASAWRVKVVRGTRRLTERELLSGDEASRVVALLDSTTPPFVETGLAHLDFSAPNLILDLEGKPVAIDNETISLAPLDLDLAICERRWPMQDWQRAAFELGYERHRDLTGFRSARAFWHLCYLTRRAALKSRRPGNAEATVIAELRELLAGR
jgi:aminoglycoside phosphotransferase (APT) family kinase protein